MKQKKAKDEEHIILYWIKNLVGSSSRFSINMVITLAGGTLYSLGIWSSPIALAIFGVVSPVLFIFCLYSMLRGLDSNDRQFPLPSVFTNPQSNRLMMWIDMTIILTMATLIHINILNYLIIRLLQTIIFPSLALLMLRILYVNLSDSEE